MPSPVRTRTRRGASRSEAAAFAAALVALAVALLFSYLGKAVCLGGEEGFWGVTRYCYSDVRVLWSFRGFDVDAVPYGGPPPGYPHDYVVEYPPGLAFPAWAVALVTDSRRAFFNVHAATFAAAAVAALWQLHVALRAMGRSRWRLLGFALSPALVLFGMQNWDLWAVVLAAAGLAAAARGRPTTAGVWFGLGAAVKWWPALLVVPLLAGSWAPAGGGGWRGVARRLRPAAAAAAAWAAVQAPAIAVSPQGWWAATAFHLRRQANLDSTIAAVTTLGSEIAPGRFWQGPFSALVTVGSLALLVTATVHVARRLHQRRIAPGNAALALVGVFLLVGKVFSPQFVLWLLPVAVVATVSWAPVVAVEAANAAVWLFYGPWMALGNDPDFTGFLRAAQATSVVRSLAVAWLVGAALLAREERADEEEHRSSQPGEQPQMAVAHVPGEQ